MKKKILYNVLTITILLTIGELVCRFGFRDGLNIWITEYNTLFQYDDTLGWHPIPNAESNYLGSHLFHVKNNSLGFRDIEHGHKTKKRILFLGDSFVWGYDVEAKDRFTNQLQNQLKDWEIINLGVSGYGTDQEYLLLQKYFNVFDPDLVFLIVNPPSDYSDNQHNLGSAKYFKPYYQQLKSGQLQLNGVPVPKGFNYYKKDMALLYSSYLFRAFFKAALIIKNPGYIQVPPVNTELVLAIKEFTEKNGARFHIGFTDIGPEQEEINLANEKGIPYINLRTAHRYTTMGQHWTPVGHDTVTNRILRKFFK